MSQNTVVLFLNSRGQNGADFTVSLNKQLNLNGNWTISLIDISVNKRINGYVCCNLVSQSEYYDFQILRAIGGKLAKPIEVPVGLHAVDAVRVYICDFNGRIISLDKKIVAVTLQLCSSNAVEGV